MNNKSILTHIPVWHLVRFMAIAVLIAALWSPVKELLAIKKSVVFFCGDRATIAWDPPSEGVADHYILKIDVVKPVKGEQNYVSWTRYVTVYSTRYTWRPEDGYNYSFRVQAVGVNGERSDFSNEELVVIADCSAPQVNINPFQALKGIKSKESAIGGAYNDRNIAYIKIDGENALLDIVNGFWQAGLKFQSIRTQVSVNAADYAGNTYSNTFRVATGPLVIRSDPSGSSLFLMGSPEFQGRFLTTLPLSLSQYPETEFYVPINIRAPGAMPVFTSVKFPPKENELIYKTMPFKRPGGFNVVGREDIAVGKGADIFLANLDEDDSMELVTCSEEGVRLINDGDVNRLNIEGYQGNTMDFTYGCSVFVLDYDDDLKYELTLALGVPSKKIYLFEQNGGKWLLDGEIFNANNMKCFSGRYAFIHWDGDGKKDLLVEDCQGRLHLFLNRGSDNAPRYEEPTLTLRLVQRKKLTPIQFMDWNNDGTMDLLGISIENQLVMWQNKGDSTFAQAEEILDLSGYGLDITSFKCGDLNMDGVPDFVLTTVGGEFFILWGTE